MEYVLSNLGINKRDNKSPKIRAGDSERLLNKFPDRVPVLITHLGNGVNINKRKYLVPKDFALGQFLFVLKKRTNLNPSEAIFIYISSKNLLVPTTLTMGEIYKNHSENGFLQMSILKENTFGEGITKVIRL